MAKKESKEKESTSSKKTTDSSETDEPQNIDATAEKQELSASDDSFEQGNDVASYGDEQDSQEQMPSDGTNYDPEHLINQFSAGQYYNGNEPVHGHSYRSNIDDFEQGHYYRGNHVIPESEYRTKADTFEEGKYYRGNEMQHESQSRTQEAPAQAYNPAAAAQPNYGQAAYYHGYPYPPVTLLCPVGYYPTTYWAAGQYANPYAAYLQQWNPYAAYYQGVYR